MLIAGRNIQKLKAQLKEEFDMKDLGEAKKILDMKIRRTGIQTDSGYFRRTMFSRCWIGST